MKKVYFEFTSSKSVLGATLWQTVTGWKRGPDLPFGVVTVWCDHCLVWSLSGVVTVWCGHCLVCSEVSHFTPSAPTSNQAPVLCRMENEKGWA